MGKWTTARSAASVLEITVANPGSDDRSHTAASVIREGRPLPHQIGDFGDGLGVVERAVAGEAALPDFGGVKNSKNKVIGGGGVSPRGRGSRGGFAGEARVHAVDIQNGAGGIDDQNRFDRLAGIRGPRSRDHFLNIVGGSRAVEANLQI